MKDWIGFFVDWDGNVRRTDKPGAGYSCTVRDFGGADQHKVVYVTADDLGHIVFEATFYETLADIEARVRGIEILLVTKSS